MNSAASPRGLLSDAAAFVVVSEAVYTLLQAMRRDIDPSVPATHTQVSGHIYRPSSHSEHIRGQQEVSESYQRVLRVSYLG
jgi:hypothetical protein